jgi:hypothetical protein
MAVKAGKTALLGMAVGDGGQIAQPHILRGAERDGELRNCSIVADEPSTRMVCSRPPASARPPLSSRWNWASAVLIEQAVTPWAVMRSGSRVMLISR